MMFYKDRTKLPDERAKDLIARMSVEEKICQLYKIGPTGFSV